MSLPLDILLNADWLGNDPKALNSGGLCAAFGQDELQHGVRRVRQALRDFEGTAGTKDPSVAGLAAGA